MTGIESLGFTIIRHVKEAAHFGNIDIVADYQGTRFCFEKDRNVWECYIIIGLERIPLVAAISIINEKQFSFEEVSFDTESLMLCWIKANINAIYSIPRKKAFIKREWKRIIKNRRKTFWTGMEKH